MNIDLPFLMGPATGFLIGGLTNWVAIKLMFRPHQPKYIFGMQLPFTPGLIPKERGSIAEAVGSSISENLMNKEVLEKNLLSEDMLTKIGDEYDTFISRQKVNAETLCEFLGHFISSQDLAKIQSDAGNDLAAQIHGRLADSNLVCELLRGHDEQLSQLRHILLDGYRQVISVHLPKILSTIDISRIIRERINEMDMDEFERIILSVMNKELHAIVWLGALLGGIIGIVNSIF